MLAPTMPSESPSTRSPAWVLACGRLVARLGMARAVLVLVTTTVAGSIGLAWSMLAFMPAEWFARSMTMTIVISASTSGPASYLLCRLLADLSHSRSRLAVIAHVDVLTGASTRRHFMETAAQRLAGARCAAVALVDVDHFKRINDRHGHPTGDRALRAVAGACRSALRRDDLFARYGGEEFVALLPGSSPQAAGHLVERMRLGIAALTLVTDDGEPIPVTASVGIAWIDGASVAAEGALEQALARADEALYEAKRDGRNRWRFHRGLAVTGDEVRNDDGDEHDGRAVRTAGAPAAGLASSREPASDAPSTAGEGARAGDAGQPLRWSVALGQAIERFGLARSTLLGVVVSTVAATLLTLALMIAIGASHLSIGVLFACTMTPLFSSVICRVLFGLVADVSRAHSALDRIVRIDALTEAGTRRHFMEQAPELLACAGPLCIVLLDIDNFKQINDRHGHASGDAVLRAVSAACRGLLRSGDLFARYGGEEFAVVLPGIDAGQAGPVVERMRQAVAALALTSPTGEPIRVTASFGVSPRQASTPAATTDESLQRGLDAADRALYRAKHRGRNRVELEPMPAM